MFTVLRNTLIYTGIYFVYCALVFLVLVTIQLCWKPIAFMFCVILALLTLGHYAPKYKVFPTPAEAMTILKAWRTA